MDVNETIKNILERLEKIERTIFESPVRERITRKKKEITLPELVRNKKLKNGQERVAVVVGYFELVAGKHDISTKDIESGWMDGKLEGTFANMLLRRAIKDGLVRDKKDGTYDLTQTGEYFFSDFLKQKGESTIA